MRCLTLALPLALAIPAGAQTTASALLREGDPLPGAAAGQLITSINSGGVNTVGGFAVEVNSSDGATTLSHAWGSADGTSPSVLFTETTVGPLVQTSFEGFLGVDDTGLVGYSASGTGGADGNFDSVFTNGVPVAVEGDGVAALPGLFWSFASRPTMDGVGQPWFVGGTRTTVSGTTSNRGLFRGNPASPILLGGDTIPGLPNVVSSASAGASFDFTVSGLGGHWMIESGMATGGAITSANDNFVLMDGAVLTIAGGRVIEGSLFPVAAGGDGVENWDNFDFMGLNEAGSYFFTGDTDGGSATDEFLFQDGALRFREGFVVDGWTLTGSIEGADMNETGDVAYIWDVDNGGTAEEALFFEDRLLLKEGDEVDWDSDGNLDAGHVLDSFTGIAALHLGSDGKVYFTADVDVLGTLLEGYFAIDTSGLTANVTEYCFGDGSGTPCPCGNPGGSDGGCANGNFANGARLTATGSISIGAGGFTLRGSRLPQNQPGLYFQGLNATSGGAGQLFGDGLRCAGGSVIRLEVAVADVTGASATTIDVAAQGGVVAGDLRRYQLWYRDPAGSPCGFAFNLTNGLELTWQP